MANISNVDNMTPVDYISSTTIASILSSISTASDLGIDLPATDNISTTGSIDTTNSVLTVGDISTTNRVTATTTSTFFIMNSTSPTSIVPTLSSLPTFGSNQTDQNETISPEEYLDELNAKFSEILLPAIFLLGTLMVIGVLGNCLVLYVYTWRAKGGGTVTRFIQALAVFDLLSCCIAIPGEILDMQHNYTFGSSSWCQIVRVSNHFCALASGTTLMVVAIDRYKRICSPLQRQITPQGAVLIIAVCAFISMVIALPSSVLFGSRSITTDIPSINGSDCSTRDRFVGTAIPLAYTVLLTLVFLVGAIILVTIYTLVGRTIFRHIKQRRNRSRRRRQVVSAKVKENNIKMATPSSPSDLSSPTSPFTPPSTGSLLLSSPGSKACPFTFPVQTANGGENIRSNEKTKICGEATELKSLRRPDDSKGLEPVVENGLDVYRNNAAVLERPTLSRSWNASNGSQTGDKLDSTTLQQPLHVNVDTAFTSGPRNNCDPNLPRGDDGDKSVIISNPASPNTERLTPQPLKKKATSHNGIHAESSSVQGLLTPSGSSTTSSSPCTQDNTTDLDSDCEPNHIKSETKLSSPNRTKLVTPSQSPTSQMSGSSNPEKSPDSEKDLSLHMNGQTCSSTDKMLILDDGHNSIETDATKDCMMNGHSTLPSSRLLARRKGDNREKQVGGHSITSPLRRHHDFDFSHKELQALRQRQRHSVAIGYTSLPEQPPDSSKGAGRKKVVLFTSASFGENDKGGRRAQSQDNNRSRSASSPRRRNSIRNFIDNRRTSLRSESLGTRRTTLMLSLITCVYLFSFLPHLALMSLKSLGVTSDHESILVHNLLIRSYFLNSVANPIIYSFCSKTFSTECKKALTCRKN